MALLKALLLGGGGNAFVIITILVFPLILSNLNAVELDTICSNLLRINCEKNDTTANQSVENSKNFALVDDKRIIFDSPLGSFTNYGTITELREGNAGGARIEFNNLGNFTNRGTISVDILLVNNNNSRVENYGTMGTLSITNGEISILNVGIMGVITTLNSYSNPKATLDYRSICKTNCSAGVDNVIFKNYGLQLTRMANDFNNNKYDITYRISVSKNASFYDANSKIILDFGGNFEFGKEYLTNMLILGNNNNPFVNLVEFYRLSLQNPDIYKLTQAGIILL